MLPSPIAALSIIFVCVWFVCACKQVTPKEIRVLGSARGRELHACCPSAASITHACAHGSHILLGAGTLLSTFLLDEESGKVTREGVKG
jgi:hypothetical protein